MPPPHFPSLKPALWPGDNTARSHGVEVNWLKMGGGAGSIDGAIFHVPSGGKTLQCAGKALCVCVCVRGWDLPLSALLQGPQLALPSAQPTESHSDIGTS